MDKSLEARIRNLPSKPGVYLFSNQKDTILYVGKSVNLKNRVSSYFNGKSKLNFAKSRMVEQIRKIDFIETRNDLEALVLETNLIKKHLPKYNVLMKDDKNLTYIKITQDPIPEVIKTRIRTADGEYFGPYPSTSDITNVLSVLRKLFRIRTCRAKFSLLPGGRWQMTGLSGRSAPCLDFYLGLCPAPCLLGAPQVEEYRNNVSQIRAFLKGDSSSILSKLEDDMHDKAKEMRFEDAAKIRDQIRSIKELSEKQLARDSIPGDNDILVMLEKYGKYFIGLTEIRAGTIESITMTKTQGSLEEERQEVLSNYLQAKYVLSDVKNLKLLTPEAVEDEILLKFLKSQKITIEQPSLGPKLDIVSFTKNNLLNFALREELGEISKRSISKKTQLGILERLGFARPEKKEITFECYDISHLSGTNTVASRSVIVNGKSTPSKYKRYKLKSIRVGEIDDFKSLSEIMERRTQEAIKLGNWPDLIIIDGGKGQLSSSLDTIRQTLCHHPDAPTVIPNICSLAKREEEVFIPGQSGAVIFEKGTPELSLLQKIRDEAHRFALNYHQKGRSKEMKKNLLEEIPGLGPKSRQKLLKAAGSVDAIRSIPRDELLKLITKAQAEKLEEYGII